MTWNSTLQGWQMTQEPDKFNISHGNHEGRCLRPRSPTFLEAEKSEIRCCRPGVWRRLTGGSFSPCLQVVEEARSLCGLLMPSPRG